MGLHEHSYLLLAYYLNARLEVQKMVCAYGTVQLHFQYIQKLQAWYRHVVTNTSKKSTVYNA